MRTSRPLFAAAVAVATLSAAACRDRETIRVNTRDANVAFAKRDSTKPLGPGDLRIATADSAVEIALIGDSLVAGLGAMTRAKVRESTDTTKVAGSGLGAGIERMVKSTVAGALDRELHMPLSDISDIQYQDGLLVFFDKHGKRMHVFEKNDVNSRRQHTRFSEEDAKDFIAVFKAKTGRA